MLNEINFEFVSPLLNIGREGIQHLTFNIQHLK